MRKATRYAGVMACPCFYAQRTAVCLLLALWMVLFVQAAQSLPWALGKYLGCLSNNLLQLPILFHSRTKLFDHVNMFVSFSAMSDILLNSDFPVNNNLVVFSKLNDPFYLIYFSCTKDTVHKSSPESLTQGIIKRWKCHYSSVTWLQTFLLTVTLY